MLTDRSAPAAKQGVTSHGDKSHQPIKNDIHKPWDVTPLRFTIVEATNSHTKEALMDHTALRRDNLNVR